MYQLIQFLFIAGFILGFVGLAIFVIGQLLKPDKVQKAPTRRAYPAPMEAEPRTTPPDKHNNVLVRSNNRRETLGREIQAVQMPNNRQRFIHH
jgi:hypothetical protein